MNQSLAKRLLHAGVGENEVMVEVGVLLQQDVEVARNDMLL